MSLSDYRTVCLPHINTQTQVTFGFRNNNYRWNPRGCSLYLLNQASFPTYLLQCDYSNQGTWKKFVQSQRFLKTKDSQFFWQRDQWNSRFNNSTVENFKTVWSNLTCQETALKSMNVLIRLPKILRIFCFHQSLQGLDNLLPSAPVRVVAA